MWGPWALYGEPLKAEALQCLGLHDNECLAMELQGSGKLIEPRHFLHHLNRKLPENQLGSIEPYKETC
jgi:hypothetical protein